MKKLDEKIELVIIGFTGVVIANVKICYYFISLLSAIFLSIRDLVTKI